MWVCIHVNPKKAEKKPSNMCHVIKMYVYSRYLKYEKKNNKYKMTNYEQQDHNLQWRKIASPDRQEPQFPVLNLKCCHGNSDC